MKQQITIIFLLLGVFMYGQETLSYKCHNKGSQSISIDVEKSSQPLNYQGKKVYIYKYEILQDGKLWGIFFTYKFGQKLYVLDGPTRSLNPYKDQALFQIPHSSYLSLKTDGIWNDAILQLEKSIDINGLEFYTYSISYNDKESIRIRQIVFDGQLNIAELHVGSDRDKCPCTKSNIVVRLK